MTNAPSSAGATTPPVAPTSPAAPIAPLPRRVAAYLIDAAIASLPAIIGSAVAFAMAGAASGGGATAVASALLTGMGITSLVMLAWFLVYSFLQGSGGSIGMRILRLRLVRDGSEAPLGFGRALLRNVVFGLSAAIVVGYFTPLFDGSGRFQGWHDRAAGAIMRDARTASGPTAAPAGAGVIAEPSAPAPTLATVPGAPQPAAGPPAPFVLTTPDPPLLQAAPAASFAPPAGAPAASTGHTLPNAPSAGGPVADPAAEADPHDATVLSAAAQAAADAAHAMITVVPGVSPSVPAPAAPVVSGPETVAPARPPVPAAAPATVADALALTPVVHPDEEDLEETRISIPGHRLQFVWDDGARATVSGRTLFGRNPAPEAGATVVVVRDETLSLSKTHFEAAAEAAGGWVMDRHSTNGMTIVRDGVRIACPPGERVRIRLGDAIEIGDRIVTVGGYA
ncbi:RDD family protein [Microbacterium sp. MMO-10]|uniref:RDD family protein n=2 Tax=Microbacterium TaxID=33882 RepID=UPI00301662E3